MPRVGVCSWSLQATGPADLVAKIRACGVDAVQLALDPVRTGEWDERQTVDELRAAGITVLSGMMATKGEDYSTLETIKATGGIAPDATWQDNLRAAGENAALCQRLGISLVTFHAGFLPHTAGDPMRAVLIDRLRQLAEVFGDAGANLAFETGQESAGTLLSVLTDINAALAPRTPKLTVGVNFDPANMILYGMGDPVAALRALAPAVRQIHIKDATATKTPGMWGEEVPAGTGDVDWAAFFQVYKSLGMQGGSQPVDLLIEREAGTSRVDDVKIARGVVAKFV
jgi:L-ribulose-5-phosphate 3-epimerase